MSSENISMLMRPQMLKTSSKANWIFRRTNVALPVVAGIGLIVSWQAVIWLFDVPSYIVPGPATVAHAIYQYNGVLMANLIPTATAAVLGFILGNMVGVLLATLFVYNTAVEKSFFPLIIFIHTIPTLAIAPVLMLIFGQGLTVKIIISAFICFFPTMVNMVRGLKSVTHSTLELMHVLSATKLEVFWKIRAPRSLPYLFASLRITAQACVTGALVGEWIGSDVGIGALILDSALNYRGPLLYAAIVAAASLAITMFVMVVLIEKRFVRWAESDTR
jgi:NitT/TauT family transport system permease protein